MPEAAATSVTIGKSEVKASYDPKYKSSMVPVMAAALKKGIDASDDFTTDDPADKDAKTFMIKVSLSISKDDKSKPTVKVTADAAGLLTGVGTSTQQFAGQSTAIATIGSRIDEDVKLAVQDAIADLTANKGRMLTAMRGFLKK
jgi:hypothetical protein